MLHHVLSNFTRTMKFKAKTISNNIVQVLLGFCLLILSANLVLSYFQNIKGEENSRSVEKTNQILEQRATLNALMKDAETGQRGFLLTNELTYLEPYNNAVTTVPIILEDLLVLTSNNPRQTQRVEKMQDLVIQKFEELQETISLQKAGLEDEAMSIVLNGKGKKLMDEFRAELASFTDFESRMFSQRSENLLQSTKIGLIIGFIAALFSSLIIIYAIITINKQIRSRRKLFEELDDNNRNYILNNGVYTQKDENQVIKELIENIQNSTYFIKKVGDGDYNVTLEGITDENRDNNINNLAGTLIEMRNTLLKVNEEEKIRSWAAQGTAHFADILRQNNDSVEKMSNKVLAELIKYLGANQGAMFILNNEDTDDQYLEMKACYAYNRKKHLNKQIRSGEGLAGQAFQEKDIIFVTDIPEEYINITSGLGKSVPTCVLIVPIMVNDEVNGVLELASFTAFKDYEIDLIKKISESLASSISSVKTNEHTRQLLLESQQMTEEMRAQEEEMRQNMEELQATQEALIRKEQDKDKSNAMVDA